MYCNRGRGDLPLFFNIWIKTISGITLRTGRVIYSPAQIWIEYALSVDDNPTLTYIDAYIDDFSITINNKTTALVKTDDLINDASKMRVVGFSLPKQMTDDAVIIFNKGGLYTDTEANPENATPIEGPWKVPLPLPDNVDIESEPEQITQPYSSLQAALDAVRAEEENVCYFDSAIFDYRSQDLYEQEKPVYIIMLRAGTITDGMSALKAYEVAAEIIDSEEIMIPISAAGLKDLGQTEAARLEAYLDRTHEVVNLAKEQGRDLAEEAFLLGNSLKGYYNGDWFLIAFETSLPQAGLNVKTQELIVAKDSTGMNFVNGRPEQN